MNFVQFLNLTISPTLKDDFSTQQYAGLESVSGLKSSLSRPGSSHNPAYHLQRGNSCPVVLAKGVVIRPNYSQIFRISLSS